jgi:hypothetical protein
MAEFDVADLYLAWRQAKTALYYERRGVGLIDLARFEEDLPSALAALQPKLADGKWFDELDPGETWVVPKRLGRPGDPGDDVVHVGTSRAAGEEPVLDVQVRLSPGPEFVVAEILYLREFGPALEALLADECIGYRLDLRDGALDPYRRWVFDYWPRRYEQFRTVPLAAARRALKGGTSQVEIVSVDLASFYDTVDPAFLLSDDFLSEVAEAEAVDIDEFKVATKSLLSAVGRFRQAASGRLGVELAVGIPIGSLTSRVIANLALATLDRHILGRPDVLAYRRYVDDLVVVTPPSDGDDGLARLVPLEVPGDDLLRLDVAALGREGCEFQVQRRKVRVHRLQGEPGQDFVEAVLADFDRAVSRSRAFLDATALLRDGATQLIRASGGEGSPLRVLRDADRTRLERFALSTSLRTLERASVLVSPEEAREMVRGTLERVGRVLNSTDDWVESLDAALRLLRLAISTADWASSKELNDRMEEVFGTTDALRANLAGLRYRGHAIEASRKRPWIWLRNYLHARRLEACCSAIRADVEASDVHAWLAGGLTIETRTLKARGLRTRAQHLATADLRSLDREDDVTTATPAGGAGDWMETELAGHAELLARFVDIREFVQRCAELEDSAWQLAPARLFLCTRPPSYFDIARRMLYRSPHRGFRANVFARLLAVVNAIRGTRYKDPVGRVRDAHTVHLPWSLEDETDAPPLASRDPRVVLGNLSVDESHWQAAMERAPVHSRARLAGLNRVLARTVYASRRRDGSGLAAPTLLVLPELTLPRKWFRAVANHIVRVGHFGAVLGLEYRHIPARSHVLNQAFAVLPGPFGSVAAWPWTKLRPARGEGGRLAALGLSFPPISKDPPRVVVETDWGRFSTLICAELIETCRVADLLGRVELVLVPAWNRDTSSYDHLIQTAGFQLHAVIALANNGHYSDCRAWAPRRERFERDLCRLIERDSNEIVQFIAPLKSLQAFQGLHTAPKGADWRPLPPNWPPHRPKKKTP